MPPLSFTAFSAAAISRLISPPSGLVGNHEITHSSFNILVLKVIDIFLFCPQLSSFQNFLRLVQAIFCCRRLLRVRFLNVWNVQLPGEVEGVKSLQNINIACRKE